MFRSDLMLRLTPFTTRDDVWIVPLLTVLFALYIVVGGWWIA